MTIKSISLFFLQKTYSLLTFYSHKFENVEYKSRCVSISQCFFSTLLLSKKRTHIQKIILSSKMTLLSCHFPLYFFSSFLSSYFDFGRDICGYVNISPYHSKRLHSWWPILHACMHFTQHQRIHALFPFLFSLFFFL